MNYSNVFLFQWVKMCARNCKKVSFFILIYQSHPELQCKKDRKSYFTKHLFLDEYKFLIDEIVNLAVTFYLR